MIKIGYAVFGAATWLSVGAFAFLFPAPDSLASAPIDAFRLGLVVSLGVLAYLPWPFIPDIAERDAEPSLYLSALPISLFSQLFLAAAAAAYVHRDFYTLLFQTVCLHYALFLGLAPRLSSRVFFRYADRLYAFTIALIAFFLVWIALMGYAVAVRKEPRWIPAIGYNIVNFGLCGFLYLANLGLHRKSKRELRVGTDGFRLDHLDITPLINPAAVPVARFLLTRRSGGNLTCRTAQSLIGKGDSSCDCSKATLCPRYKYLYNRVHELKRVFSALRLGIITDPDNRRDILKEGWRFIPDPSIAVIDIDPDRKQKVHVD